MALNKLPKVMFLILWGVTLLKLLVPFSFSSQFSIYGIIYCTYRGCEKTGRERYRTGFPAAGDIMHRKRHTEPTGMIYSRFFSAENFGQNV